MSSVEAASHIYPSCCGACVSSSEKPDLTCFDISAHVNTRCGKMDEIWFAYRNDSWLWDGSNTRLPYRVCMNVISSTMLIPGQNGTWMDNTIWQYKWSELLFGFGIKRAWTWRARKSCLFLVRKSVSDCATFNMGASAFAHTLNNMAWIVFKHYLSLGFPI